MIRRLGAPATGTVGQFVRYGVVGLINTGVHTAIASALIVLAGAVPGLANGLAFLAAASLSYVLNARWSFGAALDRWQFVKFVTIATIGFGFAYGISTAIDRAGFHFLIGILGVVAVLPLVTFALHKFWTFR